MIKGDKLLLKAWLSMHPCAPIRSTATWKIRRSLSSFHSKSSKLDETRSRDQFLLLSTKINEAIALHSAEKPFTDALKGAALKIFLEISQQTPFLAYLLLANTISADYLVLWVTRGIQSILTTN